MQAVTTPAASPEDHSLVRQLRLRDLVLAQVLTVVGSSWVGLAAGLGRAQLVAWLLAFATFYAPMAVAVYFLNREMPLEGGLYVWARRGFGDLVGFMTAWNVWTYAMTSAATILFQIPSEAAYMLGPRAAGLPENHLFVYSVLGAMVLLLGWTAFRGLGLGKWLHNLSGASMLAAFALLIVAPLWAHLHGAPIAWHPLTFALPGHDPTSLSLLGQVLGAASGLEYIAILAGETHSPGRLIGRSVIVATPVILLMFTLGTTSVVSFHNLHPGTTINYVAPIPQTLSQAFGEHGAASWIAKLVILMLQVRILGAASYLFTGVTRLPMAAGWDHLAPAWFTRLHPRFRTPVNSILLTTLVVVALLVLGSAGVHASEAFAVLNDTSSELYGLAYLAMFLIPLCGARSIRDRLPQWVGWVCVAGLLSTAFNVALNAYPFVDVPSPGRFAAKILGTTLAVNAVGYLFFRIRTRGQGAVPQAATGRTA